MVRRIVDRYTSGFAGLPREAWMLALVLLVNTSGTMVMFFMTIYLTRELGWSVARAGLGMSGYGIGMLAGTLAGGILTDRFGAFRVQRLSLVGTAGALLALSLVRQVPLVLLAAVAWGYCACALYPANSAAMASVCEPTVRARGFVLSRLAANLGATIGPVVGGILALHDYRLLFWVDAATCLAAAAVAARFFPNPHHHDASPVAEMTTSDTRGWRTDRIFLALLAITLGVSLVFSQLLSTYGMFLKLVYGFDEARIGGLIAINTGLIVVAQMPLVHAADRHSRTRFAAFGALALGIGFALTGAGRSVPFLAATVVVWTLGEMLTLPLLTTMVSLRAGTTSQGRYQGLLAMSYSVGLTIGPVIGAKVFTAWGGAVLWGSTGCVGLAVAMALLALSRHWDGHPM